jgi:hypothetical protein
MAEPQAGSAPQPLTPTQWLICATAAMGFAFDTYELFVLPLVIRPALARLRAQRIVQNCVRSLPRLSRRIRLANMATS